MRVVVGCFWFLCLVVSSVSSVVVSLVGVILVCVLFLSSLIYSFIALCVYFLVSEKW